MKMKTKLFILVFIVTLLCSSCTMMCDNLGWFCPEKHPSQNPEFNTKEDIVKSQKIIEDSSTVIEKATGDIAKEANSINKETNEAQSKIPEDAKSNVVPHLDSIKKSSDNIIEDTTKINTATAELASATSLLENAELKIETTEKTLDKITEERDSALIAKREAEEERDSALHNLMKWLIVGCAVGAGVLGVFGFLYSSKFILTLSVVCIVVMSIAIFVETYFVYVAIAGGVILLSLVGLVVYNIIVRKRAFKEVVDTVEVAQENLSNEDRKKLFGGIGETGIMDGLQSKNTMALVQKEKSKMSNLWSYSKVNKNG